MLFKLQTMAFATGVLTDEERVKGLLSGLNNSITQIVAYKALRWFAEMCICCTLHLSTWDKYNNLEFTGQGLFNVF